MAMETGPFRRGHTYFGGSPDDANDGEHLLGQEVEVEDTEHNTGRHVRLRIVRNSAGTTVEAKRLARLDVNGKEIIGYTRLPEEKGFPIDELLSSTVATNDLCYVVVEGPALALTSLSDYSSDLEADTDTRTPLNSQTAATSGATTAGRVDARALVAATADATAGQRNVTEHDGVFGVAVSSMATNSTGSDVLVDVAPKLHL